MSASPLFTQAMYRVSHRAEHFVALLSVHFDLLDVVVDARTRARLRESLILLPVEDHREEIEAFVEERFACIHFTQASFMTISLGTTI